MSSEAQAMAGASMSAARTIRAILTHPLAMLVKRALRNARWTLAGRTIANPPVPGNVRAVLFVCLGNICRSPFAAARARQLLDQAGLHWIRCDSAGIETSQGKQSPAEAVEAAEGFGLDLQSHVPVQLTSSLVSKYDMVVVMEAGQRTVVEKRFADVASRIFLLSLFDSSGPRGYERFNIADPFGWPRAAFDDCYYRIDRAVTSLVQLLTGNCSQASGQEPPAELPATWER